MSGILFCPSCGSVSFVKKGVISKSNKQRYLFKYCEATFCNTTNTVMYRKKLSKEIFRKLVSLIIDDTKIQTICDVLHISSRTAYIWRMKIYECASELVKNMILSGKIWIDETYVPVNRKELIPSPTGKKYRGLSRNQIIVACSTDEIYKSIGLENHKKLQPVNTLCSMIKRNLIIHIGMNRDYLQKYHDWICFKSTITKKNIEKKTD